MSADGLSGPLIIKPAAGAQEPFQYDEERLIVVSDAWHTEANVLAMMLNRQEDFGRCWWTAVHV